MSNVSFTVRRPTPVSRDSSDFKVPSIPAHLRSETPLGSPLSRSPRRPQPEDPDYDSSDADSTVEDELVTGFDKFGVQRHASAKRPKDDAPLVIPALRNKDWRAIARRRRGIAYVPPSAAASTGADGSVGGLGTKDTINSGPVLSGLQVKATRAPDSDADSAPPSPRDADGDTPMGPPPPVNEDDAALQAILAEANGDGPGYAGPALSIAPVSETDALRQDVDELPDAATLADYARVPVAQFGAALLRGMGWKEGTAATRKPGKGLVEPYLPPARPALLGIGAKEQEVYDDGSKNKKKGANRPERRYVPVIKQERSGSGTASPAGGERERSDRDRDRRDRSRSPRRSAASSRRASPDRDRDRYRERSRVSSPRRDDRDRDRDIDRRRADDRERRRNDDKYDSRRRDDDRDRERSSRKESSGYDRDRRR